MATHYFCQNEGRRTAVRTTIQNGAPVLNGIDYLEVVSSDQKTLKVVFLHPLPGETGAVPPEPAPVLTKENVVISGGVRITGIRAESVSAAGNELTVMVSAAGDFSLYTLHLVQSSSRLTAPAGFDPQLSEIEFSFKVECPSNFDCRTETVCPPAPLTEPEINYLAKDYATFRRLMLDRLSVVMPGWREQSPADMQVALVELLAYVGDYLSYYQDAVATEAYLGTARKRISIRRHARLLDYFMHEGSNARAWVCIEVDEASSADGGTLSQGTQLLTHGATDAVAVNPADANTILTQESPEVFETMHKMILHAGHNLMRFYTWSDSECCLPKGATKATLLDPLDEADIRTLALNEGDVLIFEEILSPTTGLASDAEPTHRCAVRLIGVSPAVDLLTNTPVVEIEWSGEDALPFPLCLTAMVTDSEGRQTSIEASVARGNVVLADHGLTIPDEPLVPSQVPDEGRYRPTVAQGPMTYQGPFNSVASATAAMVWDVHDARPAITLSGDGQTWVAQYDLLASDEFRHEFIVEMESDRIAHVRCGDGILGKQPTAGAMFTATYRIGSGTQGNVGAEAIARIVGAKNGIRAVRNPMAATGGMDPELLEQVRQFAPQAFRRQERAVTEADYATITERNTEVQQAAGNFRWTGSWYTAFVTVDRKGGRDVDVPFEKTIANYLERYRMAGYDVEVNSPLFVPLDLVLEVCVKPGYFQSDVKQLMLEVFSNRDRPTGQRGFFHPDNFTFGQPVYVSQIYQAAMQVAGAASVNVRTFQRWGKGENHELENGVLTATNLEIVQLANDPNFPENGKIEFVMHGGL